MGSALYPNTPRVAVGAVVIHDNKVLLVLRGHPPGEGLWAIPGGSVQLGERLQAAAEREILEETGLRIKAGQVIYAFDGIVHDETGRVQYHYVILDLEAELVGPPYPVTAGDDAREAGWFSLADLNRLKHSTSDTTWTLLHQLING